MLYRDSGSKSRLRNLMGDKTLIDITERELWGFHSHSLSSAQKFFLNNFLLFTEINKGSSSQKVLKRLRDFSVCTCINACANKCFKANDTQKLHLLLACYVTLSAALTTEAGPLGCYNLKTSPTYTNYFKTHSKIMFCIEMRWGGYHSVVKKVEEALWLQLDYHAYGICQTVEENLRPTLLESEICLWEDGQDSHCQDTLSAWDNKGRRVCLLSDLGHLLL